MIALVLAGGCGKRFGQEGAKQLAAVDDRGHTLTDYALYDAREAGVTDVIFVVSPTGADAFAAAVGERVACGLRVRYAVQSPPTVYGFEPGHPPLGTGHAFLCGAQGVKEPFIVLNADDFYGRAAIAQAVRCAERGEYGVVSFHAGETVGDAPVHRGICMTEGKRLKGICECTFCRDGAGKLYAEDDSCRKYVAETTPVNANLYAMQPGIVATAATCFAAFLQQGEGRECYLGDIVTNFIGRTHAIVHHLRAESHWFGMTYHTDLPAVKRRVERLVAEGEYPQYLWR